MRRISRWIIRWITWPWFGMQRRIDRQILWPALKQEAPDLDHARFAFHWHACHDRAWLALGEAATLETIDKLQ